MSINKLDYFTPPDVMYYDIMDKCSDTTYIYHSYPLFNCPDAGVFTAERYFNHKWRLFNVTIEKLTSSHMRMTIDFKNGTICKLDYATANNRPIEDMDAMVYIAIAGDTILVYGQCMETGQNQIAYHVSSEGKAIRIDNFDNIVEARYDKEGHGLFVVALKNGEEKILCDYTE